MDPVAAWQGQLENPTEDFFPALAARLREPDGLRDALREAVKFLTPRVDWEGHLPQMPHGLLGLRAVLRMRDFLAEPSFLRLLATQLHAFAHEPRKTGPQGILRIGEGSGHWGNLEMALRDHRPAIAWGEALGVAVPSLQDFERLLPFVAGDMANVGHKAVAVQQLGDLFIRLDRPKSTGRRLLALAAWVAAAEPSDRFWNARVRKRIVNLEIPRGPAQSSPEIHAVAVREVCDLGLVAMLDAFTSRMKAGLRDGDLLAILARAAAEKQLDARPDLEGKTSWNFVYLAALPALKGPEPWGQAAALVNFFPTDAEEDRLKAQEPGAEVADAEGALLEALLDSEPARAMGLVARVRAMSRDEGALRILAEAASRNDPVFHHSHQALALAAAADLLPRLPEETKALVLQALAKFLAQSQGSGDLGRLADRALQE